MSSLRSAQVEVQVADAVNRTRLRFRNDVVEAVDRLALTLLSALELVWCEPEVQRLIHILR